MRTALLATILCALPAAATPCPEIRSIRQNIDDAGVPELARFPNLRELTLTGPMDID